MSSEVSKISNNGGSGQKIKEVCLGIEARYDIKFSEIGSEQDPIARHCQLPNNRCFLEMAL